MMMFQSAPVIADGRTIWSGNECAYLKSFNPRPSLLTGEPPQCGETDRREQCFNPRPSLLTGEPDDLAC